MDDRQELEHLREIERMHELEAKAGGSAPEPKRNMEAVYRTPGNPLRKLLFGDDGSRPAPIGPRVDPASRSMAENAKLAFTGPSEEEEPSGTYPRAVEGDAPLAIPAGSVPVGFAKAVQVMNATAPARVATATGYGAAHGAATHPNDRLQGAIDEAMLSGGLAAGGELVAKGLQKAGDIGMQMAAGRRKYTPGVGTEMADQGVDAWTQRGMRENVDDALERVGNDMRTHISDIPEGVTVDNGKVATEIARNAAKPMQVAGARPSAADAEKLNLIKDFAEDVGKRGSETASQAFQRRVAAGGRAYRGKEDALKSLIGQMSKDEQRIYSGTLKDMYRATAPEVIPGAAPRMNPGNVAQNVQHAEGLATRNPEALAQADAAYGALKRAQSSLNEDPTLPKSLWGILSIGTKSIPGTAGPVSKLSRALITGGRGAEALSSPVAREMFLRELEAADAEKTK